MSIFFSKFNLRNNGYDHCLNLFLILGLFLRILIFFISNFSHDEALTVDYIEKYSYLNHWVANYYHGDGITTPPLFYVVSKVLFEVFSFYFPMKIIPLLLSVTSLGILYKFFKNISFSSDNLKFLSLILFSITCFFPFFVHFSQLFLSYSYVLFFSVLQITLLEKKIIKKKNGFGQDTWILLVNASIILSNHSSIWIFFTIFSFLIYLNLLSSSLIKITALSGILLASYWCFLGRYNLDAALEVKDVFTDTSSTFNYDFFRYLQKDFLNFCGLAGEQSLWLDLITFLFLLLFIKGIKNIFDTQKRLGWLLVSIVFIPYTLLACYSYFFSNLIDYKNLWPSYLFFWAVVIWGLVLGLFNNKACNYLIRVVIVLLLLKEMTYIYFPHGVVAQVIQKQDYIEMIDAVEKHISTKNILFVHNESEQMGMWFYLRWKLGLSIKIVGIDDLERMLPELGSYHEILTVFLISNKGDELMKVEKLIKCKRKIKFFVKELREFSLCKR